MMSLEPVETTSFSRRSQTLAKMLLFLMPMGVMIVPQGTMERTFVPETAFAILVVLTVGAVRNAYHLRGWWPMWARHRVLAALLVYFLLLSPLIALLGGAMPMVIFLASVPFSLLGFYYLFFAAEMDSEDTEWLSWSFLAAGCAVALQLTWVWMFANLEWSAGRATGVEGEKTLILPILPMAGMLALTRALGSPKRWIRGVSFSIYLFMAWAILLTVTRAMLMAYAFGSLLVFGIFAFRGRSLGIGGRITRYLGLTAFGGALVAIPLLQSWAMRMGRESEDWYTALGRLDEIAAFLEGWLKSPLWGQGIGTVFSYPSEFDMILRDQGISVPHNAIAFMLGAGGILGFCLYYGALLPSVVKAWRELRSAARIETVIRLSGWSSAILVGLVFTLTSTTYTTLSFNLFLATALFALRCPEAP